MNGCILPGTPIAVDYWRVRQQDPYLVHFLSHMHTDHTSGLSSSWRRPLYCSEITGKILRKKLQVCKSLINVLPIGQPTVIQLGHGGKETMTVTTIDANHCPGAVMFLFEGYFGRILYTADFKYTPSMFSEPGLDNCPSIDTLYLDNTYNDPQCRWPSNKESAGLIENIISTSIRHSDIVIALHKLGKEELLVRIARNFRRWIVVTKEKYELFQLLGLPNVFTTDREASNIRVVHQMEVTWKSVVHWNNGGKKTVVIIPSALFNLGKTKRAFEHPSVYLVPYTSHSSYPELLEFVRRVRPSKVIPIVKDKGSSADVSNFAKLLSQREPAAVHKKLPELLLQKPEDYRVKVGKVKNHPKPSLPKEKGIKRKIARGVVFAELSEKGVSDPGPICSLTATGGGIKDGGPEVVHPVDLSAKPSIRGEDHGYFSTSPEPASKKKKCDPRTPSTADPRLGDPSGRESQADLEEKTGEGNVCGLSQTRDGLCSRKSGELGEDARYSQHYLGHGSETSCAERKVQSESNSATASIEPQTDILPYEDSQSGSYQGREEVRTNESMPVSDTGERDERKRRIAVIPVKRRHSFYEALDKMQTLIKQRIRKT